MKSTHPYLSAFFFLIVACSAVAVPAHPRLLVPETGWEKLPARMEAQPIVADIIRATTARADLVIGEPPLERKLKGRRMLSVSRDAIGRILDLATAWKVSGERKYFERCREELLNVCAFADWHPEHHLDTAEMQTAVAIGYDWLYQELSASDRTTIASALLEKGLKPTLESDYLHRRLNNWNQVCMGGMVLSAVALMDIEPDLSAKAIETARKSVSAALVAGYPADGAYAEGGGYWSYGTEYSILTAEALRTAGLPDAGIVSHPGFLESGYYLAQVHGTSGLLFNYGDNGESRLKANPGAVWMARENESSVLRDFILPAFRSIGPNEGGRLLALAAFWFPPEEKVREDSLQNHFRGTGHSPIAIHRTGFEKKDLFLGIKAGTAKVNHGHMDAGSFVIDWAGHRWASDLGRQDYHSLEETGMNLFEMSQDSARWTAFRWNNFSHNTLTYNGRLHRVSGTARIVSSEGPPTNESVIDMTAPLDLPKGASATRRFRMDGEALRVTVTDELEGLEPGDTITWNLMTRADASPRKGGFDLSMDGKQMSLDISSPQSESVTAAPADPPPAAHDEENPGTTRLMLRAVAGQDGRIRIQAAFSAVK